MTARRAKTCRRSCILGHEATVTRHLPHPHLPHADFEEHPWLLLPIALFTIVVLAVLLIGASFALSKLFTGHAY
jgi:hypothetical protein